MSTIIKSKGATIVTNREFDPHHVVGEVEAALNLIEPEGFRQPGETIEQIAARLLVEKLG